MRYSPNIKFSVSDLFGLYAPIYLFRDITLKIRTTRTKEAKSEFGKVFTYLQFSKSYPEFTKQSKKNYEIIGHKNGPPT